MITEHRIHFEDAKQITGIASESIHLVVTSPPYPMIDMWDAQFCRQTDIRAALNSQNGSAAFELMHQQLDRVWDELYRVLIPGGIACINIGDATRTLAGEFALYSNHSRILSHMLKRGFNNLPNILWRKQTNAPTKFMGSGMMPPGAYVTLEHEYILVFRKGGKRQFDTAREKTNRRQSAFFWEERNRWFSDLWMDLKGTRQKIGDPQVRRRSGAYPFELAYRLVCMFSVLGDTVLDPFLGTGTTLFAAATAGRNGVGVEVDPSFQPLIDQGWEPALSEGRRRIAERFEQHMQFIRDRQAAGKAIKHTHRVYGFPVMTRQETELMIPLPADLQEKEPHRLRIVYETSTPSSVGQTAVLFEKPQPLNTRQLRLFD